MNIKDAVAHAKVGNRIKRYRWGEGFPYVIYLKQKDMLVQYLDDKHFVVYKPTDHDSLAYDWKVEGETNEPLIASE